MKFLRFFRPFLFLCALTVLSPQLDAQTEDETVALVRVKPADIGPWRGKVENEVSGSEGDSKSGDGADGRKQPKTAGTLEIIFDASNSMNATMGGIPKIELAKNALHHLNDTLEGTRLQVGLRVFGHDQTIDREDRPKACVNSELVVPFGPESSGPIRGFVTGLKAHGRTPIAYSLEQAGEDLGDYLEANPMVLLISDGVESCDGNPIAVISDLRQRGIRIKTHVIGFDLKEDERRALQSIAAAGDGNYYNAAGYRELLESLDQFAADVEAKAEPPEPAKYTNPFQGGTSAETAVEIGPGRYTLWKHLEKGEHSWFRVPTKKGQRVGVKAFIQGKGVFRDRSDGKIKEAPYTTAGTEVTVYNTGKEEIKGRGILLRGDQGEWQRTHYVDETGEGTLFSVGDDYGPTHQDVIFEVFVQEAGDLYEGWEAPEKPDAEGIFAAPLNDRFVGHLGIDDDADVYRIELGDTPPDKVNLHIKFSQVEEPCAARIEVLDVKTHRRITRFLGKSEINGEIPTPDGATEYLIQIRDNNPKLKHRMFSYHLELKTP